MRDIAALDETLEHRAEIARLRLTDAEREAIEASMHGENDATVIATLRKLLERLQ